MKKKKNKTLWNLVYFTAEPRADRSSCKSVFNFALHLTGNRQPDLVLYEAETFSFCLMSLTDVTVSHHSCDKQNRVLKKCFLTDPM